MICFIILHYMAKEETISCISNIRKLSGDKKIVIVDNCSPDGSGKELFDQYFNNPNVFVYLNNENVGFAKGNNIGCKVAREKFSPDFYVVMNNDIEIQQQDFIKRVEQIWNKDAFDVLGPDIFSTALEIHQSPKSLENMTIEKARKLQSDYLKKMKSKLLVPLRCYIKQIHFLDVIYHQLKSKHSRIDYSKRYYNVPLHGSCLIFSKQFIETRGNAFFPYTFFYFESEILDYECQKYSFKELYDPSVKVYHHQNISTNISFTNELERVRFMNEQNYNSISAFLDKYDLS